MSPILYHCAHCIAAKKPTLKQLESFTFCSIYGVTVDKKASQNSDIPKYNATRLYQNHVNNSVTQHSEVCLTPEARNKMLHTFSMLSL